MTKLKLQLGTPHEIQMNVMNPMEAAFLAMEKKCVKVVNYLRVSPYTLYSLYTVQ